jgi:cell division protein FtsX
MGPFVTEGMIQGALGGLVAVGMLWAALRWLSRGLVSSDLLGHAAFVLPSGLALLLVLGGMLAGVAGSLMSLSRLRV